MDAQQFDLVVIGSGPAGQKGAICAAKMRKRVAVIERKGMIGGVCVHTGTVPSKTLREAVLYLSGFQLRTFYGRNYTLKEHMSVQDLAFRVQAVVTRETEVIRAQLKRNEVTTFEGTASFVDPHTVEVVADGSSTLLRGDYVLVACGTRSAHSPDIPFDGKRILDTDRNHLDRKSTRLNSSHGYISYAVFCLKKKKKNEQLHNEKSQTPYTPTSVRKLKHP